jgi:hypothetical protein
VVHGLFETAAAEPGKTAGAISAPWHGRRLASVVGMIPFAGGLLGGITYSVQSAHVRKVKQVFNSKGEFPIRVQFTDVVLPGPLLGEFQCDPNGPIFQDEKALRDYIEGYGLIKETNICFAITCFYERQPSVATTLRKKISENLAMVLEVAKGLRGDYGLLAVKDCNVYSGDEVPDSFALYELVRERLRTRDDTRSDAHSVGKQQPKRIWKRRVTRTWTRDQPSPGWAH